MIWNTVPFLRILFPFILGILAWEYSPISLAHVLWIVLGLFTVLILLSYNKLIAIPFTRQWIYGVLFNITLMVFGYVLSGSQSNLTDSAHFNKHILESGQGLYLEITKPVTLKRKSVQAEVEVRQVQDSTTWIKTLGPAIIYFKRDSSSQNLEVGDKCLAFGNLERVAGPRNPGAFDYAKYLSRSDIFFSAYLSDKKWIRISQEREFSMQRALNRFKLNLESYLLQAGVSAEAHSVISALTLGDKAELSQDLKTSYSKAGVLHILAVSGLHVGIFYLVLGFLLGFLEKLKNGKYLKAICVIALLWGYAVLTGMSPSVSRAATMFSFVVIGTALQKNTNIYNTLCVSAFFLLLYQPVSLFNVGFLLSYTAVIGIVYLYPKIYGSWATKNWLLDKIWVLISVSLAAQIVTFPLSLHYFHQFPNYFLLANIIVVPLATCVIYLTIILFALIPIGFLAKPMAGLISFLVELLNSFVRWIENLPFSVTDGIHISSGEVLLIYGIIITVILFLNTKRKRYLFGTFVAILLLSINQVADKIAMNEQRQLIVYDVPKHSAFDVIKGSLSLLTTDSSLINDTKTIGYVMENNWRQMGIEKKEYRILESHEAAGSPVVISLINEKRIAFPLGIEVDLNKPKVDVDILILSSRCHSSIKSLDKMFNIGQLIIDSSWPKYKLNALVKACEELSIPYYSVQESGAYVQNL